jgi:mannitol-1-/sugar-/sorbitol-6-phosphatase
MALSVASIPTTVRCKGILFDMDGILISSLGSVERSWTKWALMRGIDPAHALGHIHGRRAIDTLAELRPDMDGQTELKVIEAIEIADGEGLAVLPGVLKMLASLPRDCWTVVTSATEGLARARLAACGIPVPEQMVTAETVPLGKPDPAPYLAGASLLGLAPEECVVFEDSAAGTTSGRAAGATVIATTFSHAAESLAAAHYLVPDLSAIDVEVLGDGEGLELRFAPITA